MKNVRLEPNSKWKRDLPPRETDDCRRERGNIEANPVLTEKSRRHSLGRSESPLPYWYPLPLILLLRFVAGLYNKGIFGLAIAKDERGRGISAIEL